MRLTKKELKEKFGFYPIWAGSGWVSNIATDKLGQLEDIEDELGIDLMTLFKALKNGIYVANDDNGIFHQNVLLHHDEDFFNKTSFQLYATDGFNYYLKDYGKTWALTKEELL